MSVAGRVLKIVAVGDGMVGKTTLLIAHTTGVFTDEYVPTVFENYGGTLNVDGDEYCYTLWDTAGQENFDKVRVLCYLETSVFLVCFSVNSPSSLANVKNVWVPEIQRECGKSIPLLLVGTKTDLRSSPSETVVKKVEGKRMARALKMQGYVECSAKTLTGCTEVFEAAIRAATKRHQDSWKLCPLL